MHPTSVAHFKFILLVSYMAGLSPSHASPHIRATESTPWQNDCRLEAMTQIASTSRELPSLTPIESVFGTTSFAALHFAQRL